MLNTVSTADVCGSPGLIANHHHQNLSTPRYPLRYPHNAHCEWNITADSTKKIIRLEFFDFELEPGDEFEVIEVSLLKTRL